MVGPMTKRSNSPALPSFEKFRTDFLGVLKGHYAAESLIPNILKDKALSKQCAALLWPCVNNSSARLVDISKKWNAYWDAELKVAIRGAEAAKNIYANLANCPEQAKSMRMLRNDLLEIKQGRTILPSKKLGQKQDWTVVLYAKDKLQALIGSPLPDAMLAALLNAAYLASGQDKEHTAQAIGVALTRLSSRFVKLNE